MRKDCHSYLSPDGCLWHRDPRAPRPPETREELPLPEVEASWTSLYENLVDVIDNGAELIVKPEQVRRVLQLIEAIFDSARCSAF